MAAAADTEIMFIVAPTEPDKLKRIADHISMQPERRGCDVIWRANGAWWGVQRKELKDFLASVQDGRLGKEISQMQECIAMPHVVIEGSIKFDIAGNLVWDGWGQTYTQAQWRGLMWSMQRMGVAVSYTASVTDTVTWVQMYARWSAKAKHDSIKRRPGPVNMWGKVGNRDFAIHLLQGMDGLGLDRATAIVDHFGGAPMEWTVTAEQLMEIPGIGKTIANKLMGALGNGKA